MFFALTLTAMYLYPGGSQFNADNPAFSWSENFWCELMVFETAEGKANPGALFAIAATFCAGLAVSAFFYRLPKVCPTTDHQSLILRLGTILCSFFVLMLFSSYHHQMLLAFCICSVFTMLTALITLLEAKRYLAAFTGAILFFMTQTTHLLYYLGWYKEIQPSLQKTSIFLVLVWVFVLNSRFKDPTLSG